MPDQSVPDGPDETANVEIKKWGQIPRLPTPNIITSWATELGIFDFERGVKIAETRLRCSWKWALNGARIDELHARLALPSRL